MRGNERSDVDEVADHDGRPAADHRAAAAAGGSVVVIRSAVESDITALHRVDRLIFGRLAYPFFTLRQLIDVHNRHCVVADDGHTLLGYCLGALSARPKTGWVLGLGVLPQSRNSGYGRDLISETVRRILADGAREVRLAVDPDNSAAIHVYESVGFRITGFRPHYFGPEADRLIMTAGRSHGSNAGDRHSA